MDHNLDSYIEELQVEMDSLAMDEYGFEVVQRWKERPFFGLPENVSCSGRVTGDCGDSIEVFLDVSGEIIVDAGFTTDGCGASQVCGSMCCEMAIGHTVDQAADIEGQDVLERLGRLPEDKRHCAHLASKALEAAIHSWIKG